MNINKIWTKVKETNSIGFDFHQKFLREKMKTKKKVTLTSPETTSLSNKAANYFVSEFRSDWNRFSSQKRFDNENRFSSQRYLKEIGYVDTIIDIRSTAVKKLLGIKSEPELNGETKGKR